MTMSDITIVDADDERGSYVDWPAIIGGIVLASAISVVLLAFGSAIGLSFANFRAHEGVNPIWIGIAAATWLLWVQVSSFMAGGYLTGRLRKRANDATEHEVDVRDGAHGLLVWAGALVVGAIIAVSGIGAAATAIGNTAATLTNAASNVAGGAASAPGDLLDPNAYYIDTLFRAAPAGSAEDAGAAPAAPAAATPAPAATSETPAATTAAPSTTTAAATPAPATAAAASAPAASAAPADMDAVRAETGRIFANAASGELSDADNAYLAQLVSTNTGLPPDQAQARVDEAVAAMNDAKAKVAEAAETARKTAVLAAFLTAASLLVSAAGAFWAAQMGGNHRDQGTVFPGFGRRRV